MKVLVGVTVMILGMATQARGGEHDVCAQAPGCRMASDAELALLRGGLDVDTRLGRLRLDIGITRTVSVNDELLAVSHLVVPALGRAASAAAGMAPVIVQVGPGNVAPAPEAFPNAMPTIVQNTLDHQHLKTVTIINASVNSLGVMNTMRMSEIMSRATAASGR